MVFDCWDLRFAGMLLVLIKYLVLVDLQKVEGKSTDKFRLHGGLVNTKQLAGLRFYCDTKTLSNGQDSGVAKSKANIHYADKFALSWANQKWPVATLSSTCTH